MRSLKLRLTSSLSSEKYSSLYIRTKRSALIEIIEDESINVLTRAPALYELARRGDIAVLDISKHFVASSPEEWKVGVTALSILGTPDALEQLIMLAATLRNDERNTIVNLLARSITLDYVRPFGILVRDLLDSHELDVSGWSSLALTTLLNVCSRLGFKVESEDASLLEHMYMDVVEDQSVMSSFDLE